MPLGFILASGTPFNYSVTILTFETSTIQSGISLEKEKPLFNQRKFAAKPSPDISCIFIMMYSAVFLLTIGNPSSLVFDLKFGNANL